MIAAAHAAPAPPPPSAARTSNSQRQSNLNADNENGEKTRKRKFVGFSERVEQSRARREARSRSWVERKLVIPIAFAIVIYAWYVYIGRFCLKMLRDDDDALGGVAEGVIFLVFFCCFGVMFWWSYIKLIFTPPGFAKDFVVPSPAPHQNPWLANRRRRRSAHRSGTDDGTESTWSSEDELGSSPYDELPQPRSVPNYVPEKEKKHDRDGSETGVKAGEPSVAHDKAKPRTTGDRKLAPPPMSPRKLSKPRRADPNSTSDSSPSHATSSAADQVGPQRALELKMLEVDENVCHADQSPPISETMKLPQDQTLTPPPQSGGTVLTSRTTHTTHTSGTHHTGRSNSTRDTNNSSVPEEYLHRRPSQHPALLPEYRYCYKDGFVKPMRAHHCRICGTCVLRFDHHCPWIGQCVGAHNQKFFIDFTFWSSLWTLWVLVTVVGLLAKNGDAETVDAQLIVLIALAALFSLFSIILCSSHVHLATLNQTTVEQIGVMHMKSLERENLGILVPMCAWRHSNVHHRRKTLRNRWDHEWGKLGTEGNIWWLGSRRENWEQVMGRNPWAWMLPIGRSLTDGLTYPTNPRFDAEGRWRRRNDWPVELQ